MESLVSGGFVDRRQSSVKQDWGKITGYKNGNKFKCELFQFYNFT